MDLNKQRADLIKLINYLFASPTLSRETKEKVLQSLQEIVLTLERKD